ncbi:hypothetical protein DSM104443_03856 [Usitatibacter rugosus]|uniref:Glycine rich protein n=1 Tax=Usitatibacter rugosus TaxID=2732067 RepID=A0A6M4H225_9PROT|nr:hypothetical protein [Usitatibacter rugosus]QJR12763.1 hypothetical protein DSM104443_03856 [Usitatibacter rugosus]
MKAPLRFPRTSLAVLALCATIPAWAQTCRPERTNTVCEFAYDKPVIQKWTVPAGVTKVTILAHGARGGDGGCHGGGIGAIVVAEDFPVKPGEVLSVLVGQQGQPAPLPRWNTSNGAGGGGGSFVWRGDGAASLQNVLVAAGGGGGAGCEGEPRGAAFHASGGAFNGVGGDRTSGIAGTGGGGGGGGDTFRIGNSPGTGGGGGGGIVGEGRQGAYFAVIAGREPDPQAGKGGKSIASGGAGGDGGFQEHPPGRDKGPLPNSVGGYGGFGGGGGGGGWNDNKVPGNCQGRFAGGGGGGGGYSGGGGGYSKAGGTCAKTGHGGGGGGSFAAAGAQRGVTMKAGDRKYANGFVWIAYGP